MTKKLTLMALVLVLGMGAMAEDHVMMATKKEQRRQVPAELSLSLSDAQDYAVRTNRSLRNAELAVQQAYAARWQSIAAMLPSVDLSVGYTTQRDSVFNKYKMNLMGYQMELPGTTTTSVQTAIGLNGQAIVGVLLQNVAIDMQKLQLEQNETAIRANIMSSYASVLVLQDVVTLLDSSLVNVERLYEMTQRSVELGAAEQTSADQIKVRVNTLKNNINSNKRSIQLAENALKVLLDVPVSTKLTLTTSLNEMLSVEAIMQLLGQGFVPQQNLNYMLLEKNVELAKKNVALAAVAYGPTISMYHSWSKVDYDGDGGLRMTAPNTLGVSFSMPLWSSGKRAAGVVEKKIALEEARNTFAETADNLAIQDQQLRYNLQNAYETYTNEKDNMDVTGRVFQSTTNKYHYGHASNLELVNASNDLISAQSSYVQAVLTLVNAQVEMNKFLNIK